MSASNRTAVSSVSAFWPVGLGVSFPKGLVWAFSLNLIAALPRAPMTGSVCVNKRYATSRGVSVTSRGIAGQHGRGSLRKRRQR